MTRGIPELKAAVIAELKPSWSEIVRAKKAITQILADGEPHGIRTLQGCLILADGIPLEPAHREKLQVASGDDIDTVVTPTHPMIARPRLALAGAEALIDLVALGIAVEVAESPEYATGHPIVATGNVNVPYQLGGNGGSVRYAAALPTFAPGYRLAPRHAEEASQWFLDPDLFTADLEELHLDHRARRCIVEALAAYRHNLYLGCASLLGAASEGAWYAAGEQLRHLDPQLAAALDADNSAKVVSRVAEVFRQDRGLRGTVDDLHAQAALLRQLRNYGVHPRVDETDHLERFFSDSGAALLLLETYTYLTRLSNAVASRLDSEEPASG